jgi:hypothetical protein
MMPRRLLPVLLGVVVLACALNGCGEEPVTTGEGEIPGPVPDDFPIPAGSVVGATLVDRTHHRTEMQLDVPRDPVAVIQFYVVSLVGAGYVLARSEGDDARWSIEFGRGTLRGTVLIESAGGGAATVSMSINRS